METTLERPRPTGASGPGGDATPAGNAVRTRQEMQAFHAAADDAIARGLSTDSVTFLESTTQEGGQ